MFALVNDKIMGVDSKHDRNVICIKVEYRIEESRRSYQAPPTPREKFTL